MSATTTRLHRIPRSFQSLAKSNVSPFAPPSLEFLIVVALHDPCQGLDHKISTSYAHLGVAQSTFQGRSLVFCGYFSLLWAMFSPGSSIHYPVILVRIHIDETSHGQGVLTDLLHIYHKASHPAMSISPGRRGAASSMLRRFLVVLPWHQINAEGSSLLLKLIHHDLFQITSAPIYPIHTSRNLQAPVFCAPDFPTYILQELIFPSCLTISTFQALISWGH
ncbi:hypothetical protein EV421DRAFT_1372561 [Armillaria borealis]|uniref:Uncharacterized protein n=1 Tax=Armillaria borealis TaxID=47425 RepID=A0AA39J3L4_9AGAR|nr:hypothetical protein EV421DRAFT_1372561 [Armillaria borealis]